MRLKYSACIHYSHPYIWAIGYTDAKVILVKMPLSSDHIDSLKYEHFLAVASYLLHGDVFACPAHDNIGSFLNGIVPSSSSLLPAPYWFSQAIEKTT